MTGLLSGRNLWIFLEVSIRSTEQIHLFNLLGYFFKGCLNFKDENRNRFFMEVSQQQIFLVDDEPAVLKGMARALRSLRCQISCFSDPFECLDKLRVRKCDLLVTDVRMPGMDGIELLVEAKCVVPALPVLIITGYSNREIVASAIRHGAADFIKKPVKREFFVSLVKQTLEKNP